MYGFSVDKGDEVVISLYYKLCGCKDPTYELLSEEGYAFIYSNWVIASKFAMVQPNHRFKSEQSSLQPTSEFIRTNQRYLC